MDLVGFCNFRVASGDNSTRMRIVANAVSMGTTAGIMVNKEIIEEEF